MPQKLSVEVIALKTVSYECVRYETGQPLMMAEEHVDNHIELGLVQLISDMPESVIAGGELESGNDGEPLTIESLWKLSMDPEEYLDKFPDGPEAPLARKVYEARLKALDAK